MGRSRQTTTSTQEIPEFYESFLTQDLFPAAREFANQEFTPYGGQFTAGVSPLAMGTQGLYSQMTETGPQGQQSNQFFNQLAGPNANLESAAGMYGQGATQTAAEQQASGIYGQLGGVANMTPQDYAAMTQANMSPYMSNVIDASLARAARERDIARTGEMADITRARAFGNERRGVFEAERQAAFDLGQQEMVANLMQQGYNQAQAQTMAQLQMGQAAGATAAQGLAALGGMQRQGLQAAGAGLAGLGAAEQQALQSAAAGLQSAEAQRLAGLQAGAAGMMQLGNLQQMTEQAQLDARYNEFLRQQNYPLQQLGALVSASSGTQVPMSSTQTQSSRPGATEWLGALASAGQAAAAFSDRRMKRNIRRVGERDGVTFYRWDWKPEFADMVGDSPTQGVIADELEKVHPDLVVVGPQGFKMVDYAGLQERLG